jgi:pilus assembly protein CpaB
MQRISPVILLILAIFSGGVAAYMASGWLKAKSHKVEESAQQTVPTKLVVVAAKDIVAGSTLEADLVKIVEWPENNLVPGSLSDKEELKGRVVRYPLVPGEVILESKLAPKGTLGGLAGIINNEKRAVTVKVDEASGVAGFVMPGNRVDVMVTMDNNEFKEDPVTQAVLQNLLVLGRGQELNQPKDGEKPQVVPTVTLEVTPEEGERLALAAKEGNITLALRGWSKDASSTTEGAKISSLMRLAKKAEPAFEAPIAAAPPAPKKGGVEVLRGTEKEMVNF